MKNTLRVLYLGFLLFSILFSSTSSGQSVQLFNEDFEAGGYTFSLNAGGVGTSAGPNQWIVNNEYNGLSVYPNTISEDSTYGGTISFAPYSYYLHIHDSATASTSGVSNCSYDPVNQTDRFTYMNTGICTMNMTGVDFTFFYLCEGSSTAYGEVYYSINSGPWIQTGQLQYNNKSKWKYESITNPAFDNVQNLRFGFRWVNDNGAAVNSAAFGIDDINVVGTYSNNVTIDITSVSPSPVCLGSSLFISFEFSDTLCDGIYEIEMSGPGGNFSTVTGLGVFNYFSSLTTGAIGVTIPTSTQTNGCYQVRINRMSPAPAITGTASVCFAVVACPNTISTLQPLATKDTNAVCVGSAIDVPFYSTGVFQAGNNYIAQLSDSTGNFPASPAVIGSVPDNNTYDPLQGSQPGTVSGTVPSVSPGCNYYIRVVSTNPATTGSIWGPFCIGQCDITTNNKQDLNFCISSCATNPAAIDSLIPLGTGSFNNNASYAAGNQFSVELLSSKNFARVDLGGIGAKYDTASCSINIHIPCLDSLFMMGLQPGMYYMRFIADSSSTPGNSLGTIIRLTIGSPADSVMIIPSDTAYCTGDLGAFYIFPYNFESEYQWQSPNMNGGQPFSWKYDPLLINFAGFSGIFSLALQETNYGCSGPWSTQISVQVNGPPSVAFSGSNVVCIGDTIHYQVPFDNNTYYNWTTSGGQVIDTANNEIDIRFDTVGFYNLKISAVGKCGSASNSLIVNVKAYPQANAGSDTTVCPNEPVLLNTTPVSPNYSYSWSDGSLIVGSADAINISVSGTTTYIVTVTGQGGCEVQDTVTVFVNPNPIADAGPDTTINSGEKVKLMGSGGPAYLWIPPTGLDCDTCQNPIASPKQTTTYYLTVTDANGCTSMDSVTVTVIIKDTTVVCGEIFVPNAFSPNEDAQNDVLYVRGNCIKELILVIYDRWGQKVFETEEVSKGWDGSYNGIVFNTGIFAYYLKAITTDDKQVFKSGNISLIR